MSIKVLSIRLSTFMDLVRLIADIRKDRSVFISYKDFDGYIVGFYLPPQVKNTHGIFVYAVVDKQPNIIAYSPNDGGVEVFKEEYVESPLYVNIFTSRLEKPPHETVELEDVNIVKVDISDIKSLVHIAYSTSFEHLVIPFAWYLEDEKVFLINVEVPSSGDDDDTLLIFRYRCTDIDVDKPYMAYNPKDDKVGFYDAPKDISKKYILIVKVRKFFKI